MRCWILLLLALPLAWGVAGAATYVVRPDGTGDFPTIQAAIDAAEDGDIIELADGTFTGEGNRDIDYLGKALTVRSQNGNPEFCTIDCQASDGDRHRGFVFHSNEGPGSVLEGVTITGGYHEAGGAVDCTYSSPVFVDCVFNGNQAGEIYGFGGGMACRWRSSPSLVDCVFNGNHAGEPYGEGGGMACYYQCSPVLIGCSFSGNSSRMVAGGLYCERSSSPTLEGCMFSENSAGHSCGGMLCAMESSPLLTRCTFLNNSAANLVGGLGCSIDSSPTLENCTFVGGSAGSCGGIGCTDGSNPTVRNSILAFGAHGAAVTCWDDSHVVLICCDVFGNEGGDWVGCIADQLGINGNIAANPLFCDLENGDLTLHEDSPCAPFTPPNEECDLIGAWPVGCGPTAVQMGTWGSIKAMYRR
jgi:hypothetical protein